MKVAMGNTVWSRDHRNIGTVRDLVLDADQQRVQNVIIESNETNMGTVEIPREQLANKVEDRGSITLDYTAAELESVFNAQEKHSGSLPPIREIALMDVVDKFPSVRLASATSVPVGGQDPPMVRPQGPEETVPVPGQHLVTISAGSVVIGGDGSPFGKLVRLTFESLTGAPLWLVVRRGYLFREELCLGASSIASVTEDTLYIDTVDTPDAPWVRSPGLILF